MLEILQNPTIFAALTIYSLIWKGVVLWRSARRGDLVWFLVLLVTNTLGILDAIYLFGFAGGVKDMKIPSFLSSQKKR